MTAILHSFAEHLTDAATKFQTGVDGKPSFERPEAPWRRVLEIITAVTESFSN